MMQFTDGQWWDCSDITQDDNFVLSAIFCAIEEDNKTGLEELLDVAWSIDINQANKHGESGAGARAGAGEGAGL